MRQIQLKRVYDPPGKDDGTRVLVDRVWPRGVTKDAAGIDLWLRDIAPSTELRNWFGHDPRKWSEFERRYFQELSRNASTVAQLRAAAKKGRVTLVFGAKDSEHNNAVALRDYLQKP